MKIINKPAAVLSILLLTAVWLLLAGCELLFFYEDEWELEGNARFTNSSVLNKVKFAAFYIDEAGGNLTSARDCVSNVIDLGSEEDVQKDFTLTIDMSAYEPDSGEEVHLYMWEDTDNDDSYDDGEDKSICTPSTGCPVFNSSSLAVFFFIYYDDDNPDGWYLNTPAGIMLIEDAELTGALIVNNSSL
jgi:hypothetical protein